MSILLPILTAATLEIWGTCHFGFHCQGPAIGLGTTATECRQRGGHSLMTPGGACFNL